MGFISNLGSALGGAITTAVSGISTAFKSVGKIFKDVNETTISAVCKILVGIGKFFGWIKDDEELEERGDKVIQASEEGIVPEDFDSFEAYQKKIDEFEVDPEKSMKIDPEKKLAAGMHYVALGVEKTFGAKTLLLLSLVFRAPVLFPSLLITTYLQGIKSGSVSATEIVNYYKGNEMKLKDMKRVGEFIINTEMELDEIGKKEALSRIQERQKTLQ